MVVTEENDAQLQAQSKLNSRRPSQLQNISTGTAWLHPSSQSDTGAHSPDFPWFKGTRGAWDRSAHLKTGILSPFSCRHCLWSLALNFLHHTNLPSSFLVYLIIVHQLKQHSFLKIHKLFLLQQSVPKGTKATTDWNYLIFFHGPLFKNNVSNGLQCS